MEKQEKFVGYRTLRDWANDGRPLFAACNACGREVCLIPASYAARFSGEARFWPTMKRLRCTVCRVPATIRTVPKGRVTPNLMEVFDGKRY